VCPSHGGSAPQVKAAAQRRYAELIDPAVTVLAELLHSKNERIQLRAAREVLNRGGVTAASVAQADRSLAPDVDPKIEEMLQRIRASRMSENETRSSMGRDFHRSRNDVPDPDDSVPGGDATEP
jgi:hypothetical protein